jgi:hypothetical protein
MKSIDKILLLLLFAPLAAGAQSLNFRFSTYVYGWERFDTIAPNAASTTYMRGYQNLLIDASRDKWSLNTLIQTEEELAGESEDKFSYRFYNLYVKGTNLFDALDIKLGRQYLFAGVGRGAIDGIYFKVKAGMNKEYQITGFGGAPTPYDYEFKNYNSIGDNYTFGGQFTYYGVKDLSLALSYMNKRRQTDSYYALRADSVFNTSQVLIERDPVTNELAGFDFNYSYLQRYSFYGKAYYDVKSKKLYRGEFNARGRVIDNLSVWAGYTYREPQISYNTIFWVFNSKQNQEIEGGADYGFKNGINAFARVGAVIYDSDNSLKFQAGFNHPSYGISFTKYTGYAGESDCASGYYYREILKSRLSATAAASYASYSLGDYNSERINSFSGMLGLTYRPDPRFTIDAQGQFITNRIYKYDARFLVGLSYWFFKKFQ